MGLGKRNRTDTDNDYTIVYRILTTLGWFAALGIAIAALVISVNQTDALNNYKQQEQASVGLLKSGFLVGPTNSVNATVNDLVIVPFGTNLSPTPITPTYFTFSGGIATCVISGFYKFEIFVGIQLYNIGANPTGELLTFFSPGGFASRSIVSNATGILASGNALTLYLQATAGTTYRVRISHSVPLPNVVEIFQSSCSFSATLIE